MRYCREQFLLRYPVSPGINFHNHGGYMKIKQSIELSSQASYRGPLNISGPRPIPLHTSPSKDGLRR